MTLFKSIPFSAEAFQPRHRERTATRTNEAFYLPFTSESRFCDYSRWEGEQVKNWKQYFVWFGSAHSVEHEQAKRFALKWFLHLCHVLILDTRRESFGTEHSPSHHNMPWHRFHPDPAIPIENNDNTTIRPRPNFVFDDRQRNNTHL